MNSVMQTEAPSVRATRRNAASVTSSMGASTTGKPPRSFEMRVLAKARSLDPNHFRRVTTFRYRAHRMKGSQGLILNARALRMLELPARHQVAVSSEGVTCEMESAGTIVARFLDGTIERFTVEPRDRVLAVGDVVYLELRRSDGTKEERESAQRTVAPAGGG
jgi:hypothetical protein